MFAQNLLGPRITNFNPILKIQKFSNGIVNCLVNDCHASLATLPYAQKSEKKKDHATLRLLKNQNFVAF